MKIHRQDYAAIYADGLGMILPYVRVLAGTECPDRLIAESISGRLKHHETTQANDHRNGFALS